MQRIALCLALCLGACHASQEAPERGVGVDVDFTPPADAPQPPTPQPTSGGFRVEAHSVTRKYRLWITKNWNDDHVCMSELAMYDHTGKWLNATYISMTSCYGCSQCENCSAQHGDPSVLFNNVTKGEDGEGTWACTTPGTFNRGMGAQSIEFLLDSRPMKYEILYPQVNGEWVAKDFSLEEEESEGKWLVIDEATDMKRDIIQMRNITMAAAPVYKVDHGLYPPWYYEYPEAWVYNYPSCGGKMQSPINISIMSEISAKNTGGEVLQYAYAPQDGRALANTGTGIQVAGDFGTLTLPGGVYKAFQFHFHFPAEHVIGGDDHLAVGELHIMHQKEGSNFTDDLAVVTIMLSLPLEEDVLKSSEKWFLSLGMLSLPAKGKFALPFTEAIDLNVFKDQLDGRFWQYSGSLDSPPCTEGVQWFIMEKPALVSGVVVNQWKKVFPSPQNARPVQPLNNRPVYVGKNPTAGQAR